MNAELPEGIAAEFIRQEHRLAYVILNFVRFYWRNPRTDDPRKSAALEALIWTFVGPRAFFFSGLGVVSIITLWLAWEANQLLNRQNVEISAQNHLIESQRRASLNIELSAIMDRVTDQVIKAESTGSASSGKKYDRDKNSNPEHMLRLPPIIEARIIAISRALKPYRSLPPDANVYALQLSAPRSPERGQLIIALHSANIYPSKILVEGDFSYSDLRGASLQSLHVSQAKLWNASFTGADVRGGSFFAARMQGVEFNDADARQCDFHAADLQGADMRGTLLTQTSFEKAKINGVDLEDADLRGVENLTIEQLKTAKNWEKACLSRQLAEQLGLPYSGMCLRKSKPRGAAADGVVLDSPGERVLP